MAIAKALLVCIGLGLITQLADAAVTITTTTATTEENVAAAATITTVVATSDGTLGNAAITSQTNPGQFDMVAATRVVSLNAGYTLDYETESTLQIVFTVADDTSTATGTLAITVTDIVEEFSNTIMTACVAGTSFSAGETLGTFAASLSTVTAAYSITASTPTAGDLLDIDTSSGAVKVKAGTSIKSDVTPVLTASIRLIATAPSAQTSNAVVTFILGCSSSSGSAALLAGSFTLLLTLIASLLK